MKRLILCFMVLLFLPLAAHAQQACCAIDANAQFKMFAGSEEFLKAHDLPLAYHAMDLAGSMISFPTAGGANGSAYLVSSKLHPNTVILMFHEFWGLNDYIKSEADKLSQELGVTVCAVDLYDGKVATTREDAGKFMQGLSTDRGNKLIDGIVSYFGKDTHFGTIGWCMGGGWSLQAALRAGKQADACVMYYGMPEKDLDRLKGLHAHVLGIFANKDKYITPQIVGDFKVAMGTAHKQLLVYTYDADHGFANPSNPNHDKPATDEAHKHTIVFLKRELQLF